MSLPRTVPNLVATPLSNTSVRLTWSPITGEANLNNYQVAVNGMSLATLSSSATSYTVNILVANYTYYFQVWGTQYVISPPSTSTVPPVYATTLNIPEPPTNLVSGAVSYSSFTLSWTASSGATLYQVYKGGIEYGAQQPGTSINVTGLTPSTNYWMTVRAINDDGASDASDALLVQTTAIPAPAPPVGLGYNTVTTTSFVFYWSASANATSYQVYKDGAPYGSPQAGTSISVTGLTAFTNYTMTVTATGDGGTSAPSGSLVVKTSQVPAPSAPTGLGAVNIATTSFQFYWAATSGATAYQVRIFGVAYGAQQTSTYIDVTGRSPGTTYNMTVEAIGDGGTSPASGIYQVTTAQIPAPVAPTGLSSSPPTVNSFILSWGASATATEYKIYDNGSLYQTVLAPSTSQLISGLQPNSVHPMTVIATNAGGDSSPSLTLNVLTLPAAPAIIESSNATTSSIDLFWSPSTNGADYYKIFQGAGLTFIKNTSATSTTISGLDANKAYLFTVVAHNAAGDSSATADTFQTANIGSLAYYYNGAVQIPLYSEKNGYPCAAVQFNGGTAYIRLVSKTDPTATDLMFQRNGETLAAKGIS